MYTVRDELRLAHQWMHPIRATVKLLDGSTRIRDGVIATLDDSKVIIWDMGKGFRTTPIELVEEVIRIPSLANVRKYAEIIQRFEEANQ